MTLVQTACAVVFGLIIIYAAVRLGSAAYFKSKQQFDNTRNHHGRTKS